VTAAEAQAVSPADEARAELRVAAEQAEPRAAEAQVAVCLAPELHRALLAATVGSSDEPVQAHSAGYQAVTAANSEHSSAADQAAANLRAPVAGSAADPDVFLAADPVVPDAVRRASDDCCPVHSDGSRPADWVDSCPDYLDVPPAHCSEAQSDVHCPEGWGGSPENSAALSDHCRPAAG